MKSAGKGQSGLQTARPDSEFRPGVHHTKAGRRYARTPNFRFKAATRSQIEEFRRGAAENVGLVVVAERCRGEDVVNGLQRSFVTLWIVRTSPSALRSSWS